jgi:hypothetical protein
MVNMKTLRNIGEIIVLWLIVTAGLASTLSIFIQAEPVHVVRST